MLRMTEKHTKCLVRLRIHYVHTEILTDLGWSLWLAPPTHSPCTGKLTGFITTNIPSTIPDLKDMHLFAPHITLTSEIDASQFDDPQGWLDSLPLDLEGELQVRFKEVKAGHAFFKKLYIQCEKTSWLCELATRCRAHAVLDGDRVKAGGMGGKELRSAL
ncbi:hypothetical protein MRB53_040410 [Persea americana]|nr:hypothetical protein MRB53_040410 [Persea americana]